MVRTSSVSYLVLGALLAAACSDSTSPSSSAGSYASVSVGPGHTCALNSTGAAYCWGDNSSGQLGIGTVDAVLHASPELVAGGHTFASIAAGGFYHTCGITTAGAAYCWGDNSSGQLGVGTTDLLAHASPEAVSGGLSFASLSLGSIHTCGVSTSGAGYCWGDSTYGQNASALTTNAPTALPGGHVFAGLQVGNNHSCGFVATTGLGFCWGRNSIGQLAINSTDALAHATPAAVGGGLQFGALTGGSNFECAITTVNAAYCWGKNTNGNLGDGTTNTDSLPAAVTGGFSWRELSAGASHVCGITTGNVTYCWGDNSVGALGIGTSDLLDHSAPELVTGGHAFALIVSSRSGHSCALTAEGALYCWGSNLFGELGIGTTVESDAPVLVPSPK